MLRRSRRLRFCGWCWDSFSKAKLVAAQEAQLTFDRDSLETHRAEINRQAKPQFVFTGGGAPGSSAMMAPVGLLNRGATCTDFRMQVEDVTFSRPLFETGEDHQFIMDVSTQLPPQEYTATLVDLLGISGEQKVRLESGCGR